MTEVHDPLGGMDASALLYLGLVSYSPAFQLPLFVSFILYIK